jgi:hypothetical protein
MVSFLAANNKALGFVSSANLDKKVALERRAAKELLSSENS